MGKCIIFSAPSGAGKTTIVKRLLSANLNLEFSISAASRDKRGDEKDAKDYYFLSVDQFKEKINNEEFVEWEEVYKDQFYGTLKKEVDRIWQHEKHVIFDVDVVGGLKLKEYFGKDALALFVMPPSMQALRERLSGRGTETQEKINIRLDKAKSELITADQFDYVILNDDLEKAVKASLFVIQKFLNE